MTKLYLQEHLKQSAYDFLNAHDADQIEQIAREAINLVSQLHYPGKSEVKIFKLAMPFITRKFAEYREEFLKDIVQSSTKQGVVDAYDIMSQLTMIAALPDNYSGQNDNIQRY